MSVYEAKNQIDGEALLCLTERCFEKLIPVMGHRAKLLKLLADLHEKKNAQPSCCGPVPETDDTIEKNVGTAGKSLDVSRGSDPQANSQPRCVYFMLDLLCYC